MARTKPSQVTVAADVAATDCQGPLHITRGWARFSDQPDVALAFVYARALVGTALPTGPHAVLSLWNPDGSGAGAWRRRLLLQHLQRATAH